MKNTTIPGSDKLIWTLSGKSFDLFTPPQEFDHYKNDFNVNDIARGLSHICRWGGQVNRFYSVAQHCIVTAQVLMKLGKNDMVYPGLVHDAPEAYIDDMQRPLKLHFPEYQHVEQKLEETLMPALGAPVRKPDIVKSVDSLLAWCESDVLGLRHVFDDPCYKPFNEYCENFLDELDMNPEDLVVDMSIDEARETWKEIFMEWKPDYIQVDDMGFIRSDARLKPGY